MDETGVLVALVLVGLMGFGITQLDHLRPKSRMVAVAAGSLGLLLIAVVGFLFA